MKAIKAGGVMKAIKVKSMTGLDIDRMARGGMTRDSIIRQFSNVDPSGLTDDQKMKVLLEIRKHNFE